MARQQTKLRLQLRMGMRTGDVILTADDFFGTVVATAARITAAACPGDALISDATRLMLGPAEDITLDEPERIRLKGVPGTHILHRLIP